MTDPDRYDVVFTGELARGAELSQTQAGLAKLFKLKIEKVQALFSGKRVVLKRNLSFDQASQYRVLIKKAGALVELSSSAIAAPVAPINAPVDVRPPVAPQPSVPSSPTQTDGELSISEPGADVLAPEERQQWKEKQVDTSHLSVKDVGEDLLDSSEKRVFEERDVDLGAFDLAEPGEDVLRPDERQPFEETQVDTSAMSLAEPGTRLQKEKREAASMPDTSRLSLQD